MPRKKKQATIKDPGSKKSPKKKSGAKKKPRGRKRKPHPLEGIVRFEHDDLKTGDEIVYKRLGDGSTSIGIIQYFDKTIGEPCVTVIDLLLGTFHTALIKHIEREPTKKLVRSLWARAESKASPRRSKRV
jgi:hypothetical protein